MRSKIILIIVLLLSVAALAIAYSSKSTEAIVNYSNQSPSDYISDSQIRVYSDKVIIDVPGVTWTRYNSTDSMKPVIDDGANGLEVPPRSEDELKVGDIVSYQAFWNDTLVVHRIIEIGQDSFGKYYVLKGDNNDGPDPGRIRFSQIKYKTIAIIY